MSHWNWWLNTNMTQAEQTALKALVEWKRNNDSYMDYLKRIHNVELDDSGMEIKAHKTMEMHKANLVLQAVAAELVESYVKSQTNPKMIGEIKA